MKKFCFVMLDSINRTPYIWKYINAADYKYDIILWDRGRNSDSCGAEKCYYYYTKASAPGGISKAKKMADNSKKCLKLKLYAFFFLGLCLLIFCWYYLTAFAAVYQNTQLHLIKDTLISFGISMIYPFIINLIPGFLRIPSLKAVNKDQKCMYKISKIIAFF